MWNDEDGASFVEYGLLILLIAVVCMVSMSLIGNIISSLLVIP